MGGCPKINKHLPLYRDYNRLPNIKALKRREFVNQGSTSGFFPWGPDLTNPDIQAGMEL